MKKLALFTCAATFALVSVSTTSAFAGPARIDNTKFSVKTEAKSDVLKIAQKKQEKKQENTTKGKTKK
ncbi:hypothetical protein ACFWXH_25950 [Mesorhizobium sp. NPDC059054]|uniref:hypothetical protein n=1 Tax=Mesorhizobium sp. NPDC059054 TaxID=3346711 RepID=UPI0036931DBC